VKCLVTADLHYNLRQFDWVLGVAGDFDIVILAGDHLDMFSTVDGRAQSVVVGKYLERLAPMTRLLICSGNHDLDSRDGTGEKTARWVAGFRALGIPTDDDTVVVEDTFFSICPWWDGPAAKEKVAAKLARDAKIAKRAWAWLYHAPPDGARTSQEGERPLGEKELLEWIGLHRPDYVFCGHVHNAPFMGGGSWIDRVGSTWVFNAGRQIGDVPAHIILDTRSALAVWSSLAGSQLVELNRPFIFPLQKLTEIPPWAQASGCGTRSEPIVNS
jgi:Icc-related predicted phosphoesterase